MSTSMTIAERLLTWLDVERVLKQKTELWSRLPSGVISVDCFPSNLEIRYNCDEVAVDKWLSGIFENSYLRENRNIRLRMSNDSYHVDLIKENQSTDFPVAASYPLWRDVTYLPLDDTEAQVPEGGDKNKTAERSPKAWETGPDLVSFHSFKGGVGRTTALMTYVAACIEDTTSTRKKILIIDADLEAPGVSFWLDETNKPKVSFIQLLEALHYPPESVEKSVDFFAQELRKTSISIGSLQKEIFILPAALDLTEIQDMPVTPEHLARNPSNPWQLADHLHSLGKKLGADAIFIDLRAGLSELASPILFDPRIDHFFVSTVAPQSVLGMVEVLRRLYAVNRKLPDAQQNNVRPTVILSLLTNQLREAGHYERAIKALSEAYPTSDTLTPGIQWLEAEFQNPLMSISSVREALTLLPQSIPLFASAKEWAKALYSESSSLEDSEPRENISKGVRQQKASALYEICNQAQFAESSPSSSLLATEPLLNLGKHYKEELPSILMIGAKGSGKTFTFNQLLAAGNWRQFLSKIGFEEESVISAKLFPVLWSENINDSPEGNIKKAQRKTLEIFTRNHAPLKSSDIRKQITAALKSPPEHWEDFWIKLISKQLEIKEPSLEEINKSAQEKKERIIFVFDGIEDTFKDTNDPVAIEAIQALLRLPSSLNELEDRRIGVIVFVRADYVQATVRQNVGQLMQRFHPFRLQWNPESFLRLAFMLSCQAKIIPDNPKLAESLRVDDLKDKLESLWGKKLGGERSKEAHSARWVYAALSDLKGNVQARDLVRFLKFAAENEIQRRSQDWPDRLLAPESMRNAIPKCSEEKVTEAKSEIAPLRNWIEIMEERGIRDLKIPFSLEQAGLSTTLLSSLQELGVIYEDLDGNLGEERLFLPEIYRLGLKFVTSTTGRPRTQSLLKKNIGVIPL